MLSYRTDSQTDQNTILTHWDHSSILDDFDGRGHLQGLASDWIIYWNKGDYLSGQ